MLAGSGAVLIQLMSRGQILHPGSIFHLRPFFHVVIAHSDFVNFAAIPIIPIIA